MTSYIQEITWVGSGVADPINIVDGGDFDAEGSFRAASDSLDATFTAFTASTPDGTLSVRFEPNFGNYWALRVRGVDVLLNNNVFPTNSASFAWRIGDDVKWRAWYRPSTGQSGIRINVNGVFAPDTVGTTTGGALAEATAATVGAGSMADATYPQFFGAVAFASTPVPERPEIVILGDSTVGSFAFTAAQGPLAGARSGLISVAHDIYTVTERHARPGIGLVAVPGDDSPGQKSKWEATPWWSQGSGVKALIIEVGVNDRSGGAPYSSSQIQSIITSSRAHFGSGLKIFLAKIVPFTRFESPTWVPFLLELNEDIAGTGPNPISGTDAIISSHYPELDNGFGGFKDIYNFDLIHENSSGRTVIAHAYRTALVAHGILPSVPPAPVGRSSGMRFFGGFRSYRRTS